MNFEKEKESKEKQIESLTKELTEVKLQIRSEKRKLDDVEDQEDRLNEERQQLLAELERLEDEFELLEVQQSSTHSESQDGPSGLHEEDDDLLIQKLEQESQYLSKLLFSAEEEYSKTQDEVKKTQTQNQMLEHENVSLEKKVKGMVNLDEDLQRLQQELSGKLDTEKKLFDENLELLKKLKQLEIAEQETQKHFMEQEEYLRLMQDQTLMERKGRNFENMMYELNGKLDYKLRAFNLIKWKFEKAQQIVSDSDIRKIVGIDGFKQKVEKFQLDINQLVQTKENIMKQKQGLDAKMIIKDIKSAQRKDVELNSKSLKDLELELDEIIQRENDIIDLNRLMKNYSDLQRDTETEFLRKFKSLKEEIKLKIINLIQDNVFSDPKKQELDDIKYQIRQILYDIEEYDIQKELNIELQVAYLKTDSSETQQVNRDIKFYFELEFIEQFKLYQQKQDIRQSIQNKLKKINDNINELDKLLQNNSQNLDNLQKEASYLKESEFSPVKGRSSIVYGVKGDLEKENELQIQNKQMEQQQIKFEIHKYEKEKLKKLLKQYQQKFDDLDLENSNIIKLEELIDEVNTDLDYKTEDLKAQVRNQAEQELKAIESQVNERLEKFQQKRQVLSECRYEEKEKRQDILKCDGMSSKLQSRLDKLEKDLKFQTNGTSLSQEKQNQLNQDLKDISQLKAQMNSINKELEDQKILIHSITQEMNMIGDKIVTLDHLKSILAQIQEMNKLKKIQDSMKNLGEQITMKEVAVEQFISDLLGVSLFDCERKFKEAEQLVDKISKRIIELNNGLNDFEIDLKKGVHLYQNDEDLQKEGKKVQDENNSNRKELKALEDQKNLVRKVLHKIKNSLNEQEQLKSSKDSSSAGLKITASAIEEFINEIQTCKAKCETQEKDLNQIDQDIQKRQEQWTKTLFKGAAKDALVDDLEKSQNSISTVLDQLQQRLRDIESLTKALEEVSKSMIDNPDYELRKASIKKLQDSLQEMKTKKDSITKEISTVSSNLQKLKDASAKGLRNFNIESLQDLAKLVEESQDKLSKESKKADLLLREVNKKRLKLGDADINDNLRNRQEMLMKIEEKGRRIALEQIELDKILQKTSQVNAVSVNESIKKIEDLKRSIARTLADKDQAKIKIQTLREKVRSKDLNREDPTLFIPIIGELRDLRQQLLDLDENLNKSQTQIKFLKNKHGGIDLEDKFNQFGLKVNDLSVRLQSLLNEQEILKDLFECFDGYTSDTQEEDFIDKLGIEIKEISIKHANASDHNEKIKDKIAQAQKNLSRQGEQEISSSEIEKRAQLISEIEEEAYTNERMVVDLENRTVRNKKIFLGMQAREKLGRREQECLELSKRLLQFESQVNEIEAEIRDEINQQRQNTQGGGGESVQALENILKQIQTVKQDYQQPGLSLKSIYQKLEDLKRNTNYHQFDLLKENIQIKKQILQNLNLIKQVRVLYNQLKIQFENNKAKKQIAYKAIKGDYVDQLLADWINNNNCPVPISRLGNGFYMFGSKKIFAKIINGKLLIRVGGGYMGIDEFMFYYGAQELNRMLAYEDFEGEDELDLDMVVDTDSNKSDLIKQFGDGKSVIGAQQFKKRLSPRPVGTSPRPGSPHQSAGSRKMASPRGANQVIMTTVSQGSPRNRQGVYGTAQSSSSQSSFLKQGNAKLGEQSHR